MAKSETKTKSKKKTTKPSKQPQKITKRVTKNKISEIRNNKNSKEEKKKIYMMFVTIFFLGVLLIFSAYAWFSTSLNVKVKTFNVVVTKNSGLTISFDAITFDYAIEISQDYLLNELENTYPNHLSQWAANGLIPVSTAGIPHSNTYFYDVFSSDGVKYKKKNIDDGLLTTVKEPEEYPRNFNRFIAFDVFLRNETGSPISDNLYIDNGTGIFLDEEDVPEEMYGLINSVRIGFVKVGSLPLDANPTDIQNLECNNQCESVIFEPNNTIHTDYSIEKSKKYGINLINGREFPTYSYIKAGGPFHVSDTISGSVNLDPEYFRLQKTISESEEYEPIFTIPDGITKMRVYVWIEGQDIDSLETDSQGADVSVSINFIKDTQGYEAFN